MREVLKRTATGALFLLCGKYRLLHLYPVRLPDSFLVAVFDELVNFSKRCNFLSGHSEYSIEIRNTGAY